MPPASNTPPIADDVLAGLELGSPRRPAIDAALLRLAQRLRQLRQERGYLLAELSAVTGISEAHLWRIEAAERWPSLPALLTLAGAYGVAASSLLREGTLPGEDTLHEARAVWLGQEDSGSGVMKSEGCAVDYNLGSRLSSSQERNGNDRRSSPEELIGMALAGCFSMSLAQSLSAAGFPPTRIATEAKVTLRSSTDEIKIAGIQLRCTAEADGVNRAHFDEIAQLTKRSCVVARALGGTPVTLDAELRSGHPIPRQEDEK